MPNDPESDPIELFKSWMADAERSEPSLANAVTLATVAPDGSPSARMVLLKDVTDRGFTFFTNLGSRKGRELIANPKAALCFHWKSLGRQVRVEGRVEQVDDAEADAYFATRDRGAQIGAWASKQSHPLRGRFELEKRVAEFTARFHVGAIPRPEFWSGFRVVPHAVEFWRHGAFRLHERLVYRRLRDGWTTERLFP